MSATHSYMNKKQVRIMYKIPYGESNFESIRTENYLYVDKTHFIKEIERTKKLIHLRPRRFGKSLFLSMLDSYYDVAGVEKFDELFQGLYIHKNPTKSKNNYYILRFNFSGVENVTKDCLRTGFLDVVKDGVNDFINRYDFDFKASDSNSPASVLSCLLTNFSALKLSHKIYILIDEYDYFTNSILEGDGGEFLALLKWGGFVRSFYEVIKEKSELGIVDRFFMTGVMPLTLDSMTSGFNIATNITTRKSYASMMGFTAEEVKGILASTFYDTEEDDVEKIKNKLILTSAEQEEIFNVFRENYNGYMFSENRDIKIFNSTLIMYYLSLRLEEGQSPKRLLDPNLNQSSAIIENIVGLKTPERNVKLIREIVNEKEIEGELVDFFDLDKRFDHNDIITMLFNLGILTLKQSDYDTFFEIPNTIIKRIYLQYLNDLQQRESGYCIDTRDQMLAFREIGRTGNITALTKIVEEILLHTSNQNALDLDEKHIKFCYFIQTYITKDFAPYDEFPSGKGYADLFIGRSVPSNSKYEVFIEFKYLSKGATNETSLAEKLQEGIAQVKSYLTDKRLANRPDLKKYVIVFSGHEAKIVHELELD